LTNKNLTHAIIKIFKNILSWVKEFINSDQSGSHSLLKHKWTITMRKKNNTLKAHKSSNYNITSTVIIKFWQPSYCIIRKNLKNIFSVILVNFNHFVNFLFYIKKKLENHKNEKKKYNIYIARVEDWTKNWVWKFLGCNWGNWKKYHCWLHGII